MKELLEAIKNRPKALVPDYHADCRKMFQKVEESFRKIEIAFADFQKNHVIVPRKQLEDELRRTGSGERFGKRAYLKKLLEG